jgi:cation transporter-like permease
MRKALPVILVIGVIAILGVMGWAIWASREMGSWTGGSTAILIMMVGGAVFTGGLTGVLMWLAFYSERKGYDEPFRFDAADEDP